MISTIIVDDEPRAVRALEILLEKHCAEVDLVGTAGNIDEAYKLIVDKKPALIFLDINMPNGTGLDLLQIIKDKEDAKVVFTTAHQEYAIEALRLSAMDYLLKPIDKNELKAAVDRFQKSARSHTKEILALSEFLKNQDSKRISINSTDGVIVVNLDDIYFLSSEKNYSIFNLRNSTILASKSLGDYERVLPESQFIRIHRSIIVNLDKVKMYDKKRKGLILENDCFLEVSRNKKDFLMKKLKVI